MAAKKENFRANVSKKTDPREINLGDGETSQAHDVDSNSPQHKEQDQDSRQEQQKEPEHKASRGRPQKYNKARTINVKVEEETYEMMLILKKGYNDNLSEYVNALILKDLEPKRDELKAMVESYKRLGIIK